MVKAELAALKAQLDEMKTPPVKKTVRKRGGK